MEKEIREEERTTPHTPTLKNYNLLYTQRQSTIRSRRDPNLLRNTRHAIVVHRKYKPVARHHHSRIAGDIHVPHVVDVPSRVEGGTPLIGINRVGGGTHAHEGKVVDRATSIELDGRADLPDVWATGDGGARGKGSITIVEVRRIVDDGIVVVGSAAITAETSSTRKDGRVGQENGSAVVCPRDGLGRHLVEVVAVGVPQLRLILSRVVREWLWVDLATGDEDLAIRQHD